MSEYSHERRRPRLAPTWYRLATAGAACVASGSAWAVNPALQDLFFAACANPTAALAARCAQTDGAAGDLSGDSESSLNPSQPLSGNQLALRAALGRADDARSRAEDGTAATEGARVDLGRVSLLVNYAHTWEERERVQDLDAERGYEADTDDVEAGFDYRLSDTTFAGLLLNYQRLDADFDAENAGTNFTPAAHAGRIDGDSYGVTGFLSLGLGTNGYLDLSAGYRAGENDYRRYSVFQESNRIVPQVDSVTEGTADTREFWGAVNAGWDFPAGPWTFGLTAGATYSDSRVDGYREDDESGSGLAMDVSSADQTSIVGQLGARAQYAMSTDFGVLVPSVRVDYSHEFDGDAASLSAGYLLDAGGNRLILEGDDADDDFVTLGGALTLVLPNGWMPFVDVSYWAGYDDLDRLRVLAGLRKEL